jgi:hypothetical protein
MPTHKVATNLRIEPGQLKSLKRLALDQDISLSSLFRQIVAEYLERTAPLDGSAWGDDPFFKIGERPGRAGAARVSEEHDRDLYPVGRRA